jgi:hypothetical protein
MSAAIKDRKPSQAGTKKRKGAPASETEKLAANRRFLFKALRAAGVSRAVVNYSGSGDSGGPDGVRYENPQGEIKPVALPRLSQYETLSEYVEDQWRSTFKLTQRALSDAIMDHAMDAVETRFAGWENNEGAQGDVIFDVGASSVTAEHHQFYIESEYSEVQV